MTQVWVCIVMCLDLTSMRKKKITSDRVSYRGVGALESPPRNLEVIIVASLCCLSQIASEAI